MKDPHNCAGQLQLQHTRYPVHIRKIQLAGGYQINENITGFNTLSHEQMPQISLMSLFVVKRHGIFAEIVLNTAQDFAIIFIDDAAFIHRDDIIKLPRLCMPSAKRTVLVFVSEGEFHLVSVGLLLGGLALDPFKGVV